MFTFTAKKASPYHGADPICVVIVTNDFETFRVMLREFQDNGFEVNY